MSKAKKILCYLLLSGLLLVFTWVLLEMPRFSAESAFRRVEQRQLLEQSEILSIRECNFIQMLGGGVNSGSWKSYLVTGVSDTHLRMTLVENRGWRWLSRHELVGFPLEECTFSILPWDVPVGADEGFHYSGFLYTKLPYARGEAVLTVGNRQFPAQFTPHESGLTIFSFPGLDTGDEYEQMVAYAAYDLLQQYGYNEALRTMDVTLELTLFDENGNQLTRVSRLYPKYQKE